jgi:hypothetical protein
MVYIQANIQNAGDSRWFGHYGALPIGETRVLCQIYKDNILASENRLFIPSFDVKPGQNSVALGVVNLPTEEAEYSIEFDFIAEGVGEIPQKDKIPPRVVKITR